MTHAALQDIYQFPGVNVTDPSPRIFKTRPHLWLRQPFSACEERKHRENASIEAANVQVTLSVCEHADKPGNSSCDP